MGKIRKQINIDWLKSWIETCKESRANVQKLITSGNNIGPEYYSKLEYYQGMIDAFEMILKR